MHQDDPTSSDLFLVWREGPARGAPLRRGFPGALEVVNIFNKQHLVGPGVKSPTVISMADGKCISARRIPPRAGRSSGSTACATPLAAELAAGLACAAAPELRASPPKAHRADRSRIHDETTPPGGRRGMLAHGVDPGIPFHCPPCEARPDAPDV